MQQPPTADVTDAALHVHEPMQSAAGMSAVVRSLQHLNAQMNPLRASRALLRINQKKGFDCPGCAWPEGHHRKTAEFCENGAKAVAEEATERRVAESFWAEHSLAELRDRSDYWLGQQGRLLQPVYAAPGATHYTPVDWVTALGVAADALRRVTDPDRAVFYTSGRTSNEAAFAYQLLIRALGTNNLPDCSNMCHESSGSALSETIGIGKGSVSLDDLEHAELIVVMGQNPGTNHPRMLSTLAAAKRNGASIVSVNPLPEAGLLRFKDPQRPDGVIGHGTALTDQFLQVRLNGDLALLQAVGRRLLEREDLDGHVVDHDFVRNHTDGLEEYRRHLNGLDPEHVRQATGLRDEEVEELADRFARSKRTIICWAMGLTQHKNSVPTIREIVNLLLLQGNIGKPGAGVCPVRGHSNVQGNRTMGIYEKPSSVFLDALEAEFGINPPREHGYDTVEAIHAMRDEKVDVFVAMGGNFASATPDSAITAAAMQRVPLVVSISTKLNRTHTLGGNGSLILPTLGRTERDVQASGPQAVSVEDSMSRVHLSRGRLAPPDQDLLSEVAIVCRLGAALVPEAAPWAAWEQDYRLIREAIGRVVPDCEGYAERVEHLDGFVLPHPPRDSRTFPTATGRARFTANPLVVLDVPPGRLLLQTLRSHDQYNTTIYGLDDHYRGIEQGRRVVMVHPDDLRDLGLTSGQLVDLVSEWTDGERRAPAFRTVSYPSARGCAAAYFPETNVLVPLDSTADTSNTPTSKSVVIRLEPVSSG